MLRNRKSFNLTKEEAAAVLGQDDFGLLTWL